MEDRRAGLTGRHAWLAGFALWDALFVGAFLGSAVFVASVGRDGGLSLALALGLLVSQVIWYLLIGRVVIRRDVIGRDNVRYALIVAATFVASCIAAPAASISLIGIIPLVFWTLRPRPAVLLAVVLALVPLAVEVVGARSVEQAVREQGPLTLGIVVGCLTIGLWIATIIEQSQERAALIDELAATREELARTAERAGVEAERTRLAGDIHDAVSQSLHSIAMLAQAAEYALRRPDLDRTTQEEVGRQVALIETTAREAVAETVAIVNELRPPALEDSVMVALERLGERHRQASGLDVSVTVSGEPRRLPTPAEVAVLRMVQEAISNVARHADAREVEVGVTFGESLIDVTVRDDGGGFDPGAVATGRGLDGMRRRIEGCGGELTVTSGPDGSLLRARIPISASQVTP